MEPSAVSSSNPKNEKRKETAMQKTIISAHKGLADIFDHRLFQFVPPELCIKLETHSRKHEKMTFYVQLLGYYHGSLSGLVVYESFDDFQSMIYKEQTIDNLAAAKKAHYIVYLPKNYKSSGIDGDNNKLKNGYSQNKKDANSPYADPKSRVSATHWSMIKELNVCSMDAMNPKLPIIPCFTPRLEKLNDPQQTLLSLIWISYILHYLFIEHTPLQKKLSIDDISSYYAQLRAHKSIKHSDPLTHRQAANGEWKSIKDHKFKMIELGGYRLGADQNEYGILVSFPFGLDQINTNKLCLRPWLKTLPYIFNTMKNCGDGLVYFEKKLKEAKSKIILRKVTKENWLQDPAGIDFINYTKGIVGVYLKIAWSDCNYYLKAIDLLNDALDKDTRDTLKCRGLKLKCLLFSHQYTAYLEELKSCKFYDEKKVHRIDSNLSWNVTFCYFVLYGRESVKTIESVKKSIQNHVNILYILIGIKAENCANMRNQRDLTRHLAYYYEFGHFWLSHPHIYEFIINDVLYYYLDCKSRPLTHFLRSSNRPFTMAQTPILYRPKCINTSCQNKGNENELFQCKQSRTAYFCSIKCQSVCMDKKYGIECEMIKKTKRIYNFFQKVFKYRQVDTQKKNEVDDEKKQMNENLNVIEEDKALKMSIKSNGKRKNDKENVQNNDKIRNQSRGKRKSIEMEQSKMDKNTKKVRQRMIDAARKRRGSVELELE